MRKILLAAYLLTIVNVIWAQNAIPNPGFENWTNFGSYDDPDNWGTINSLTSILGVKTVTKATGVDVHSGTYAIHLESKNVPFQGTAPGIAATGTINTSGYIDGGLAYNKRPISITGWYKYIPGGTDTGSVEATLSKWNAGTQQREVVGHALFEQNTTVSSYTQFTANFTYSSANYPDTMVIILLTSSQGNNAPTGSKLYIDDLDLILCSPNYSVAASTTDATCTASNGSAIVTASNGTTPYSYSWSNSGTTNPITNIAAATYNVTVTDGNGCSATTSATVSATSNPITVTANSTQSSCTSNTGSVTALGSNGAQPYTYLWSDNSTTSTVSNLGAGNYSVTVHDSNGCSGTGTTSITTPNGPSATKAITNVACHADSTGGINIIVTGGTGTITFLWSNGATTENISQVAAGTYTVTLTDANSCSFALSGTVTQPASVLASTAVVTNATSSSAADGYITVTPTGGTSPYSFAWSSGNGANLAAGGYCYTVTDANNCVTSACDTVSAPSGIGNISIGIINLYPNPANNHIVIETNSVDGKFSFRLYNLEGKLVEEKDISGEKANLDVKGLSVGLYTYQLKNLSSGKMSCGKLQIER